VDFVLGTDHKDIEGRTGILIYLSSWTGQSESLLRPAKYLENNLTDLALILTNNNFDGVIFPSSNTVYDKNGNLEPNSIYGLTKLAGEKLIKIYCKRYWILRLANVYGERDRLSVLYTLSQCKLKNKTFNLYVKEGMVRDYLSSDDVAQVINRIIDGEIEPGIHNVGSGESVDIVSVLKDICKKFDIVYKCMDLPHGVVDGYIPTDRLIKVKGRNLEEEWKRYIE
jgi:nucleoside-diphosphate-sugar epimerase